MALTAVVVSDPFDASTVDSGEDQVFEMSCVWQLQFIRGFIDLSQDLEETIAALG